MASHRHRLAAPPEIVEEDPPLSSLMSQRLLAITPDADLEIALRLLADATVRHLPVMDGTRCLGLLFEHDLVLCVAEGRELRGMVAADLCRSAPALRPTDHRSAAVARMRESGLDAVLVTIEDRLVGIVTTTDVVRSLGGNPLTESTTGRRFPP